MQAVFEFVRRYEICRHEDYCVELEEHRRPTDSAQMLIAHMHVFRWAPSVLKRMKREWEEHRVTFKDDVYAYPLVDEPKWHKFVCAVGFKPLTTVRCLDGSTRPMYINRIEKDARSSNLILHNQSEHERDE